MNDTTIGAAHAFASAIADARRDEMERRSERRWEPSGNYASGLSDCARASYYNRALWADRDPIPVHVHPRLQVGDWVHKEVQKWFMDHFNVINVELPLNEDEWNLRGRVDLVVGYEHHTRVHQMPVEIKSITDNAWAKCQTLETLMEQEWTRKYVRQTWAYCLAHGVEAGLLMFVGLPSGNFNPVVVPLDYEAAETSIAERCELVEKSVMAFKAVMAKSAHEERFEIAEQFAPDRIDYDAAVCGRCSWLGICGPGRAASGRDLEMITDPDFIGDVRRKLELDPLVKEHEGCKERIKGRLRGVETAVAGPYAIKGKEITSRRLTVPKEYKASLKAGHPDWVKTISYWKHIIEPIVTEADTTWEQAKVADRLRRVLKQGKEK